MNNFKAKEATYLLKRLYEDIDFYKSGLKEILLYLDTRLEVVDRFKGNGDELYKYVQAGEILDDIKKNYIEHESVCNTDGEIVDFKKVYQVKAERMILDTQMCLIELEDDEDIEAILVSQQEAKEIIKNNNTPMDIRAYLALQSFSLLGEKMFI